jgi:hypothetical protein
LGQSAIRLANIAAKSMVDLKKAAPMPSDAATPIADRTN